MPKFQVRIEELAYYVIAVEAEDSEAAQEAALETFLHAKDVQQYFSHTDAREVDAVIAVDEAGLPVADPS